MRDALHGLLTEDTTDVMVALSSHLDTIIEKYANKQAVTSEMGGSQERAIPILNLSQTARPDFGSKIMSSTTTNRLGRSKMMSK